MSVFKKKSDLLNMLIRMVWVLTIGPYCVFLAYFIVHYFWESRLKSEFIIGFAHKGREYALV
jgi:hypothetical protein